ncbi:MAG TPA: phosphotransferase [Bryobacteraceae bacterium]|nr:phosphotransferase [Bryobacteraceae bacterium]
MIPQDKSAAVTHGLREAFGLTTFEDIRMLSSGLGSALVFRIVVRGSPYLLRIVTRPNAMNDPTRHFTIMRLAAEAGLAPRVRYSSIEDGICVSDFVEAAPLSSTEARARVPGVLRTLHALTPFPKALNYVTVDAIIRKFQAANLLPKDEIGEVFNRYGQLSAVYPRLDSDMVSCHNDLKPENILFDGHRIWLVDWKAAFTNDRYFDLAIVANFLAANGADENAYLQDYFGQPPDPYQLSRFFLMRQVMHMMAAAVYLLLGSSGKPVDQNEKLPSFQDFHRRIWAGEVNLADSGMKTVYGRVHWEQLLENVRHPRFDEALRIVSDRHAGSEGIPRLLPPAH